MMLVSLVASALILLPALSVSGVDAAAKYEPPNGSCYLSFWPDVQAYNATTTSGGDSPAQIQTRLGLNPGGYQLSQEIPVGTIEGSGGYLNNVNLTLIEETKTDAILFMTVYPNKGFDQVQGSDVEFLASQLHNITVLSNRRVILRLAPEMNGNWIDTWHGRPLQYVEFWKTIYTAVKAVAPDVAFAWSPNEGANYPFGTVVTSPKGKYPNATEYKALDTT
ncbi:hypothetical protein HK101_011363, partial [Irineochytrium annulatum]